MTAGDVRNETRFVERTPLYEITLKAHCLHAAGVTAYHFASPGICSGLHRPALFLPPAHGRRQSTLLHGSGLFVSVWHGAFFEQLKKAEEEAVLAREKKMQETMSSIKRKFGKTQS